MTMVGFPSMLGQVASIRQSGGLLPPISDVGGLGVGPYVVDTSSARKIPAVQRCLGIYTGLVRQCPMNAYRGGVPLPRPALLDRPDPLKGGSWFVGVNVEDYLLNGNALHYVTSRGADGWPLTVQWWPSSWWYIQWFPPNPASVSYYLLGHEVDAADVVHVMRGADRFYPVRGVGVVEENLSTLNRVVMETEYESSALSGGAVPSVAVIASTPTLNQDVADQAKADWMGKFGGPVREPVFLPNGSQIVPLSWSPTDTQLIEARKQSLTDVANMFNIDGYWLGAPVAGMTYRTAGPQYQQILRTSLEPVLADFESVWSDAWLPRGKTVHFDRNQLLRDDLNTTATALATLVAAGIITGPEARAYLDLPTAQGDPTAQLGITGPPQDTAGMVPPDLTGGPETDLQGVPA
jgi:HK97 family phage portal protein